MLRAFPLPAGPKSSTFSSALLVMIVVLGGCHSPTKPPSNVSRHAQLAAAIEDADRVEVRWGRGAPDSAPVLTKSDPHVGEEFSTTVPIDDFADGFWCECAPSQSLRFYRRDTLLADLSVRARRHVRWEHGRWSGDAQFAGEAGYAYMAWFRQIGGSVGQMFPPISPVSARGAFEKKRDEANVIFASHFPTAAHQIASNAGPTTTEGFDARREASDLRVLVPDNVALATAAFRAFGVHPSPWTMDDWRTGAIQSAVAELPATDLVRALEASADDPSALRGAARFYFRLSLYRQFEAAANAAWLPRLADAVLATGRREDKPMMLLYLAGSGEPAAANFLRAIAMGEHTYPWAMECDRRALVTHEPSLRAAAVVLLAVVGESVSLARPKANALGAELDRAALEIAESLLNPARPLRAAHFRHPSHILAYAAAEALGRQDPATIPASVMSAALLHEDHWVTRRVRPLATRLRLQLFREPTEVNLFDSPVSQNLAARDPAEAIRQCSDQLPRVWGHRRTALLLIRAVAHETLDHRADAIADYEAALKAGGYSPEIIHEKLAWLKFWEGRFIEAIANIEHALRIKPKSDLHVLRGLLRYAADDFSVETEMDFMAAMSLAPGEGYARIFQHLTSVLGGRPDLSRLRVRYEPKTETKAPTTITISPVSLSIDTGPSNEVPWWPANILRYLAGEITREKLLELAQSDRLPGNQNACEAYFYIAQTERIAGRLDAERQALEAAVTTNATATAEFKLAQIRLSRLQPAVPARQ